ncbi:MAG: cation transporter [Ruminococcus sp.]|nr:cation transporter [Ruminococcus sp.]
MVYHIQYSKFSGAVILSDNTTVINRDKIIVKTSIIGIITNVFLSAFKAGVGLLANSIAVILDAVNNLSDALSSVITIVGTKLAGKAPDKKHPLGYGRIEYLSAMIVSAIVLYAGMTSLVESIKKIIHPQEADYNTVSIIIISVAIVAKILLGTFVKAQGKKANSTALVASGSDALFDAVLSASVLASAIIYLITKVSLEAYVGVVISLFILKAGLEMMFETVDDILGKRTDKELSKKIKNIITKEPEVRGAYDLVISNYGPDKNIASVHVELRDTMTVEEVDTLTRRIESNVFSETGVFITGVGVYSYNTSDSEAAKVRNTVMEKVLAHDWALQLHGFYADTSAKTMRFDVVMSFEISAKEGLEELYNELKPLFPDYDIQISPDVDISD